MLTTAGRRSTGVYEFAVLLAMTALGFGGAPWWVVPIAAVMLLSIGLFEHADVRTRLINSAATTAAGYAALSLAAISVAFAALCYAGGGVLAALMYG